MVFSLVFVNCKGLECTRYETFEEYNESIRKKNSVKKSISNKPKNNYNSPHDVSPQCKDEEQWSKQLTCAFEFVTYDWCMMKCMFWKGCNYR